ncbi:MAG: hypothetical protein OQK32_01530, partial [Gammaproteobacteria bacterium]|nr:hypothetical protein [Gammaproteobacteria bacterium]
SEYLEGNGVIDNGALAGVDDQDDKFIHATATSSTEATPYNDVFVTITRDEIWNPILSRSDFTQKMENLTQALAMCLAEYANFADNTSRRLPWPVITDLSGNDYRDNTKYQDDNNASNGYSGRFPFDITNSNDAINAAALTTDTLFDMANCNSLALAGAGVTADLVNDTEYRKLWNNWKDHFFYILSKGYEPANTGENNCAGSGACIKVNTAEYAGAVIFSGSRLGGVSRSDKSVVSDYLEDDKGAVFNDEANIANQTGDRTYVYTDPQTDTKNDIMYCIQDKPVDDPSTPSINESEPLTVIECI